MAALNIAFAAPDNAVACPSRGRPIDLVHLARQTMGDKALEIEVLQMFARQSRQIVQALGSEDSQQRQAAVHRLRGAALAVGAFNVATLAAAIEDQPDDAPGLAALGAAVLETEIFILRLCR
jgi:HPt (histidine-containing phosphotransfer) domain-containing protein